VTDADATRMRAVAALGAAITSATPAMRADHLAVAVMALTLAAANEAERRTIESLKDAETAVTEQSNAIGELAEAIRECAQEITNLSSWVGAVLESNQDLRRRMEKMEARHGY
jgi:hypothetical protein